MKYNIKIKNLFFFGLIAIIFCFPVRKVLAQNVCGDSQPFGDCQAWCSTGYSEHPSGSGDCKENTFQTTCCVQSNDSSEDSSSSDFCNDSSTGKEGICEFSSCSDGEVELTSSDCSGNWVKKTCCGEGTILDVKYDCYSAEDPTIGGTCQMNDCPSGSLTLISSGCEDNWFQKTCCHIFDDKLISTPISASSSSGLGQNSTSTSSRNVNNSNASNNSGSSSAGTTAMVAMPSQCGTGQTGGDQYLCSSANDSDILKQCNVFYADSPMDCASMQKYLARMTSDCQKMTVTQEVSGIDCAGISQGGFYGREASKFASYLVSKVPSGGSSGVGATSGAGGLDFDSIARTGIPDSPNVKVVLVNIVKWMLEIIGIITLIAFIISGGQYLMASGDDKMIETAKKNMTYSVIGIIVALSGFVIIRAIDMALRATSSLF